MYRYARRLDYLTNSFTLVSIIVSLREIHGTDVIWSMTRWRAMKGFSGDPDLELSSLDLIIDTDDFERLVKHCHTIINGFQHLLWHVPSVCRNKTVEL